MQEIALDECQGSLDSEVLEAKNTASDVSNSANCAGLWNNQASSNSKAVYKLAGCSLRSKSTLRSIVYTQNFQY